MELQAIRPPSGTPPGPAPGPAPGGAEQSSALGSPFSRPGGFYLVVEHQKAWSGRWNHVSKHALLIWGRCSRQAARRSWLGLLGHAGSHPLLLEMTEEAPGGPGCAAARADSGRVHLRSRGKLTPPDAATKTRSSTWRNSNAEKKKDSAGTVRRCRSASKRRV